MKIINKPVKELYPEAEVIYSQDDGWGWKYSLFIVIMYYIIFMFVTIYVISKLLFIFNFDYRFYLLIFIIGYLWVKYTLWGDHLITKIYYFNNELIFSSYLFRNLSVVINISELSYILLRRMKYDHKIIMLKYTLFSSLPTGIIFQIGLFRFRLERIFGYYYLDYDPPYLKNIDKMFQKLNDFNNIIIINNYDYSLNWKHKYIEIKLHFQRFVFLLMSVFIKPLIFIYRIIFKIVTGDFINRK